MNFFIFSWPDGVWKSYLMDNLHKKIWLPAIPMYTTRPTRTSDDKISISHKEFMDLQLRWDLFWVHTNMNWHLYWYNKNAFIDYNLWMLEINPVYQKYSDIINFMETYGWRIIYWFWLVSDKDYLKSNMKLRDPKITDEQLLVKLDMWEEIQNELFRIWNTSLDSFKLIHIDRINRDTLLNEISDYVSQTK